MYYNPVVNINKQKFDVTATAYSIAALTCWIIGPLCIKQLTGWLDFWTQNMLRYSIAALLLLPFLLFSIRHKKVDHSIWKNALVPTIPNIVMQSCWAAGFYYINPALLTLIAKSGILWTILFSMIFFFDERPLLKSTRFWTASAAMIIGLVGVTILSPNFAAKATIIGLVFVFCSSFTWSLYTIGIKAFLPDYDSRISFAVVSLYTTVALIIVAVLFGNPAGCLSMPPLGWIIVIVSGATSLALSHSFYYAAIKRIGATIPSLVTLAQPFGVLVVSRVIFAETLTAPQWIFGIILLAGAALAVWAQEHLNKN
jgi:drug/metabolite transporter (DMT)-like permease